MGDDRAGTSPKVIAPDFVSDEKLAKQGVVSRILKAGKPDAYSINDEQFIKDLQQLKKLRSFLIKEAVKLEVTDRNAFAFGALNLLRYHPFGRLPTEPEWSQVEFLTQSLFQLPTEAIRRKFVLGGIPWWMSGLPMIFALVGLISLVLSIVSQQTNLLGLATIRANILPFYLVWLMSLGAIGSIAFIGMNALSVQDDATFDLSNTRLMVLRISLGALFGLVLTLPFGFVGFVQFITGIANGAPAAPTTESSGAEVTTQALRLLLPFILGFSTSLVILILNRLVEAVQGFFGKPASEHLPAPPAAVKP
jgi:hypothetical protein